MVVIKWKKSCSFFGHRKIEITDELRGNLKNHLIDLIENKAVGVFYFGGFGDFDDLCYQIVSELKRDFPEIKRIFCTADKRWLRESKRPKWLQNEEYEDIVYLDLDFDYWYSIIYYRNCAIIGDSDFVVFYVTNTENSGAYKAMQYAKKKKKSLLNFGNI